MDLMYVCITWTSIEVRINVILLHYVKVWWRTSWSSTSWGVTVCWKVSESAERASPAESCMVTSSRGSSSYCPDLLFNFSIIHCLMEAKLISSSIIADTKYWMPVSSLRDNSLTTRRPQRNSWGPSTLINLNTSLDTLRSGDTENIGTHETAVGCSWC